MIDSNRPAHLGVPGVGMRDSLRGVIAGGGAADLFGASAAIFAAAGKDVLSASAQQAVRNVAERVAKGALASVTGPILASATRLAEGIRSAEAAVRADGPRSVVIGAGKLAVRGAGKEILKGAVKSASIGFMLDGAMATIDAVVAVRNGSSTTRSALKYVTKEAATGAIAAGAGVLLGASLVALTGGVAVPVVFAVGALGSIGAKRFLRRIVG